MIQTNAYLWAGLAAWLVVATMAIVREGAKNWKAIPARASSAGCVVPEAESPAEQYAGHCATDEGMAEAPDRREELA